MKLIDSVNLKNLHETPNARELDAVTVAEWFRQNGFVRFFTDIGEVTTMSVYGVPAARMSMLYYIYYAKSAGGLEKLLECTKDGAQRFRIRVCHSFNILLFRILTFRVALNKLPIAWLMRWESTILC